MIYLDNAATTMPNNSVLEKASEFNQTKYFNPSALYQQGLVANRAIKSAKETILAKLGALNHELIFTSCGSESDNQAIFCSAKHGDFVTSKGEHSAVYKSFLELKNRGKTVYFIDLNEDGTVNEEKLINYIKNNKVGFVSLVHVNNETGGINDINHIASLIKSIDKNIIFHADGVQAFGKIPYKISNDIDLYSISAHKINALKGTGALIKKKGINLMPLIFGGGQENGLRSGTENVFGIKVFELATMDKYNNIHDNFSKISNFNAYMRENLDNNLFTIISNPNGSPYILTMAVKGLRGEVIMHALEGEGVIVGNGSACSSKNKYSRVIEACGYDSKILDGVIRVSFSVDNTIEEIISATDIINKTVYKLKGILTNG